MLLNDILNNASLKTGLTRVSYDASKFPTSASNVTISTIFRRLQVNHSIKYHAAQSLSRRTEGREIFHFVFMGRNARIVSLCR